MQNYQRVRITAKLKTCSYLHIGSGEDVFDSTENRTRCVIKTTAKPPQYYIPASSLRGFLHGKGNQLKNVFSRKLVEKLFGCSNENTRQMGCCRFSNAYATTDLGLEKRHGIELNPQTRLVKKNKLYSYEVVPADAEFDFYLEMDACSDAEIKAVCELIAYWDGTEYSALGSKRGQGFGKIQFEKLKIQTLTGKSIQEWLDKDDDLSNYFQDYSLPVQHTPKPKTYTCTLHATSPIIVLDASKTTGNQLICHQTNDKRGLIPGTSLKGILKGHCRKILLTILTQYSDEPVIAEVCVKKFLDSIFGTEKIAGFIKVSEAVSINPLSINSRPMIAIDRFSGGVKGGGEKNEIREEKAQGALLEILAADNELWRITMHSHETIAAPEGSGWKGLLLLTLRDAMEGDLSIGLGKARGFGSFRIEPEFKDITYSTWDELMPELQRHYPLEGWINALHNELTASVQKIKEAS